MTSNTFIVDDLVELRVMHRVFREAKFCTEADDLEISDSPIVARMFERLIKTLVARSVERDGEVAAKQWERWLAIDESRDEWAAAIRRATLEKQWLTFASTDREDYVKVLLSPFTLSPETIEKFVRAVNQSLESNPRADPSFD
jgi:hypothetical protein